MIVCTRCFITKNKKSFPRNGMKVKGTVCNSCKELARQEKGSLSKEEAKESHNNMISRGVIAKCSYCLVEKCASEFYTKRDYGKVYLNTTKCKKCQKEDVRYRTFGITELEYDFLLQLQDYCCAICTIHLESYKKQGYRNNFAVDHCHKTGKIRGLLCDGCNRGLGLFKENTVSLSKAIKYLSL